MKLPRIQVEQIRAILDGEVFDWAFQKLKSSETMDEMKYSDFIEVSDGDIERYVTENGFSANTVYEADSLKACRSHEADDHICILAVPGGWEVFYSERGETRDHVRCTTKVDAQREVLRRLIRGARIALNHRYRAAHPELDLPPPSEME